MEELSSQHNSHLLLALKALLQKQEAGTQEEIRAALEKQGFLVNQTKISRLLQQIGAIKIREHEHVVYRLSTETVQVTASQPLKNLVVSIDRNESLIVVRTVPSAGQLVARLLDMNLESLGILGTVAGDDTIFIAPKRVSQLSGLQKRIVALLS